MYPSKNRKTARTGRSRTTIKRSTMTDDYCCRTTTMTYRMIKLNSPTGKHDAHKHGRARTHRKRTTRTESKRPNAESPPRTRATRGAVGGAGFFAAAAAAAGTRCRTVAASTGWPPATTTIHRYDTAVKRIRLPRGRI